MEGVLVYEEQFSSVITMHAHLRWGSTESQFYKLCKDANWWHLILLFLFYGRVPSIHLDHALSPIIMPWINKHLHAQPFVPLIVVAAHESYLITLNLVWKRKICEEFLRNIHEKIYISCYSLTEYLALYLFCLTFRPSLPIHYNLNDAHSLLCSYDSPIEFHHSNESLEAS